jgi:hypothetical protein
MSKPEITTTTELILSGSIVQVPIKVSGTLKDGSLAELSGCAAIRKSLSSLLDDLGTDFGEAVTELSKLVGGQVPDIALETLAFGYNIEQKFVQVVATITADGSSCHFVLLKKVGKDGFIVGLDLQSDIALKNNLLSGLVGEISIRDLGIYYASKTFQNIKYYPSEALQDVEILTPDIREIKDRNFRKGWNLSAEILVGGINLLDWSGIKDGEKAGPEEREADDDIRSDKGAKETQPSKGLTIWIKVDKSIGPLSVRRVGLSYEAPRVGIKFDAGLQLSCLTLSLEGMGLSYPLDHFTKDPKKIWEHLQFHLDGAAVAFEEGPLTISGGLLKVKDDPLQLDGALLIRTEIFTISAFGSYVDVNGTPSFFAFAALHKELGGPAFFFVTGLAFGFGMNRALKLPSINEVQNFPLVKAATDPDYLGKKLDLRKISQKLGDSIYPSPGNLWIAAGVKFTSFGMIDSFALLSVSFGTQFEIALLGLSKIRIPKPPAKTIAYAELAIKVLFAPENGLLSIEARLTENSYLLRKDFKLRGGFAFYSWFAGKHEGDFVISLGGYHPRFQPPAHYPKPDLVEFNCKIGHTTINGHCYFALCPSAVMAGGGLSIVYQSGGIKAWFIAYADFLIQWKPLYYDIAIGISIGVALHLKIGIIRINLSLELSASVNLYGPPLGGKARISLWIITFTVKFGEDQRVPPPLLWESDDPEKSFAASFLPNPEVTRISIADGLLKEVKDGNKITRFVNPHKLVLSCRTLVPVSAARFNDKESTEIPDLKVNGKAATEFPHPTLNGKPTELGVRPMGKSTLYSLINITLEPNGNASEGARRYLDQYIDCSLTTKSVPLALWGRDALNTLSPPEDQMIDHALVGVEIRTKPGPRPWETPALDLKVLAYDRYQKHFNGPAVEPKEALPAFGDKTISNTIEKRDVVNKRKKILDTLTATGRKIMNPKDIHLSQLEKNAQYIFQAMPAMARVGQNPPRGYLDT